MNRAASEPDTEAQPGSAARVMNTEMGLLTMAEAMLSAVMY